jgi:hypothetical protein
MKVSSAEENQLKFSPGKKQNFRFPLANDGIAKKNENEELHIRS